MINGLGYKLANVPTITGLSTVTADNVISGITNTDQLIVNGTDVSTVITQVPINTANIAILQQLTTGITYSDAGGIDLTTVDNNLTITTGKKLKCATTATDNDDVANKLFVSTAIANLVDSAPATLDTLNELAFALGDDPNFATTVTNLIAGKVSLTTDETISGKKIFTKQLGSSAPGGGYAPTAYFADSSFPSGGYIGIIPYSGSGAFNNFPATGDGLIYSISNAIDTKNIVLSTWSTQTNGIRVSPSSVLLGAGGTSATPTSSIKFEGTVASMTGDLKLTSANSYIYSTNTTSNLNIQSASGRGLNFFTNGGLTNPFILSSAGVATFNTAVPLCSIAPTTGDMLCNKTYVDGTIITNYVTTNTAQTISAIKTFTAVPLCNIAPTTGDMLCNKTYVDGTLITNYVTTNTAQTISAIKTFTAVPLCSIAPTTSDMLCNKAYVDSSVVTNYVTTNTAQNITAVKTFSDTSIIFTDSIPNATTLKQNSVSGDFEMTQNYLSGGYNFISKNNVGTDKTVSIANSTITAELYKVSDTAGGLNFGSHSYSGSDYTMLNSANGDIIFKTYNGTTSTTQFIINNTNCSFTQPPLCSVFPTTANMLCNKNYVDSSFVSLSTTQTVSGQKAFTNALNTYAGSGSSLTGVVHTTSNESIAGNKTFTDNIILSDGGSNNSTIDQFAYQFNLHNNVLNNTTTTITGLIPSVNYGCLVRTDSATPVSNYGSIIAGPNINVLYFNNFYVGVTTTAIAGLNILSLTTVQTDRPLTIGETIISGIGTYYSLGTYILNLVSTGVYTLSQNALVSTSSKISINLSYTPLNRAYLPAGATAGSITLDYNTTTNLKCLNQSSVMLNAIEIKPSTTSSRVTMFGDVICKGGHNWNFYSPSTGITASITLTYPFYQIYAIVSATAITITLPTATTAMLGAHFLFKKVISNALITFNVVGGASAIIAFNGLSPVASVTMTTAQFQSEFVCNGAIYYQFNMT